MTNVTPKLTRIVSRTRYIEGKRFVGAAVNMLLSADPNCQDGCGGTGWVPDWQDRCMRRCPCTDPAEVVHGT